MFDWALKTGSEFRLLSGRKAFKDNKGTLHSPQVFLDAAMREKLGIYPVQANRPTVGKYQTGGFDYTAGVLSDGVYVVPFVLNDLPTETNVDTFNQYVNTTMQGIRVAAAGSDPTKIGEYNLNADIIRNPVPEEGTPEYAMMKAEADAVGETVQELYDTWKRKAIEWGTTLRTLTGIQRKFYRLSLEAATPEDFETLETQFFDTVKPYLLTFGLYEEPELEGDALDNTNDGNAV